MAYAGQNFRAEQTGFEYPPVPSTYSDPYFTSDVYSEHQTPAPVHVSSHLSSSYRSYESHAIASYAAAPHYSSYPDPRLGVPTFRQIAPAPSPASLPTPQTATYPAFTIGAPPPANVKTTKFVSYSAENQNNKRPRGTTGRIVCQDCGKRFTVLGSLTRHSKICRGKKTAKKSISTQHKKIKTEAGLTSDNKDNTTNAVQPCPSHTQEQGPVIALNGDPLVSTVHDSPSAEDATLMSDLIAANAKMQKPRLLQLYVPRGPDTFPDRKVYFCDVCPGTFPRRDILQAHKAEIHGLAETPYLPDSRVIEKPQYLINVTYENATEHSGLALRTFEGGGLSTSPCEPCVTKRLDCIVNPSVSAKCCYCSHRDNGSICGAAGVKYRSVSNNLSRVDTSC